MDTSDEWIRNAPGSRATGRRRHHGGSPPRPAARRSSAGVTRPIDLSSSPQRPPINDAGHLAPCNMPSESLRRVRSQRRVLWIRLRAGRRPRPHPIGAGAILVIGSETLSRITDWDDRSTASCSPTVPARRPRSRRGTRRCSGGTSGATARCRRSSMRHRRLHENGGQGGLPPGRAAWWTPPSSRCGGRRHRRRHRADRAPPGQHPDHRAACQARRPHGTHRQTCLDHRQHVVRLDPFALAGPPTRAGSKPATSCSWSASGPG